ncbi:glycosyltransferase family 2 protein [Microbacterium sp.]|uniref:glycosyltransferase family 2 protein n=1 Tax=Microbacterium sp. TaxID=51671 RepID=UPI00289D4DEA|nr:glycosyltransferase family 2 protein [Microbacterium sp.]
MNAIRVSVCMATYNGERYLAPQLESILAELEPQDEVVVVDDASTDGTVAVLAGFDDPRIRVHARGDNRGYVRTFEEALNRATGDVVMLSDQDDVWIPGRRALFLAALEDSAVAASNLVLLGSDDPLPNPITRRPWRLRAAWSRQGVRNALRILAGMAPYYGCAMAVRRDALDRVLPFPPYLDESHDLWIALVGNAHRTMTHIEAPTIRRRIHDANASPSRPRGIGAVLRARVMLLRAWGSALRR